MASGMYGTMPLSSWATQECDPPAVVVPYGMWLVCPSMPTLYDYAYQWSFEYVKQRGCDRL